MNNNIITNSTKVNDAILLNFQNKNGFDLENMLNEYLSYFSIEEINKIYNLILNKYITSKGNLFSHKVVFDYFPELKQALQDKTIIDYFKNADNFKKLSADGVNLLQFYPFYSLNEYKKGSSIIMKQHNLFLSNDINSLNGFQNIINNYKKNNKLNLNDFRYKIDMYLKLLIVFKYTPIYNKSLIVYRLEGYTDTYNTTDNEKKWWNNTVNSCNNTEFISKFMSTIETPFLREDRRAKNLHYKIKVKGIPLITYTKKINELISFDISGSANDREPEILIPPCKMKCLKILNKDTRYLYYEVIPNSHIEIINELITNIVKLYKVLTESNLQNINLNINSNINSNVNNLFRMFKLSEQPQILKVNKKNNNRNIQNINLQKIPKKNLFQNTKSLKTRDYETITNFLNDILRNIISPKISEKIKAKILLSNKEQINSINNTLNQVKDQNTDYDNLSENIIIVNELLKKIKELEEKKIKELEEKKMELARIRQHRLNSIAIYKTFSNTNNIQGLTSFKYESKAKPRIHRFINTNRFRFNKAKININRGTRKGVTYLSKLFNRKKLNNL
jgi:hypothetical protein